MGDRYIITVKCPNCEKETEDVYYAPTCGFTEWKCEYCGHLIDLAEYTGISYEDASNKELIDEIGKSMENNIRLKVITPHGAFGAKEDYLVEAILRAIAEFYGDKNNWPTKYGIVYENEVFMMHTFCWCAEDDCPWCNGNAPNFWYKPTDFKVTWYKYIGRSMEFNRKITIPEAAEILSECIKAKDVE